jgi:hypothetical protein
MSTTGCVPFGVGTVVPYSGFVYRDVPAFALEPGDVLAFDLMTPNDTDVRWSIALAQGMWSGSGQPAEPFTTVVSSAQVPGNARGNRVLGDYELRFPVTAPYTFPGGGLVMRLSDPAGPFATDSTCDGSAVGGSSSDASRFFASRFLMDADGGYPWDSLDGVDIPAFRTVALNGLAVTTGGMGSGWVESTPAGIDCGATADGGHGDCAARYDDRTPVTLTAHPEPGFDFTGFDAAGCQPGTSTCTLTIGSDRRVGATFTRATRALTVTTEGSGAGRVESSPGGIYCGRTVVGGASCSRQYHAGTVVTLTARPDARSDFGGFSGAGCSGADTTCTVTTDEARSVTATFATRGQVVIVGDAVMRPSSGVVDVPVTCRYAATGVCETDVTLQFNGLRNRLAPIGVAGVRIPRGGTIVVKLGASNRQRKRMRAIGTLPVTVRATRPPAPDVTEASVLHGVRPRSRDEPLWRRGG